MSVMTKYKKRGGTKVVRFFPAIRSVGFTEAAGGRVDPAPQGVGEVRGSASEAGAAEFTAGIQSPHHHRSFAATLNSAGPSYLLRN